MAALARLTLGGVASLASGLSSPDPVDRIGDSLPSLKSLETKYQVHHTSTDGVFRYKHVGPSHRVSLPRYLGLTAWPRLRAGTVITRNARCAPSPRALYPNFAIDPLAYARPGRRRNRRLQIWLGRRATRRCQFRLDRRSRCNRLHDAIRQERLTIGDNRRGRRFIRRQTRVRAARRLQHGIQTICKTRGNGAINNQMNA